MSTIPDIVIQQAKDGDAAALETLVRAIQGTVYRLSTRMLADPLAAEDATQEILIRIITKLSTFAGESRFETWAYRVATNYLLTARKVIARDPGLSFRMFSDDLLTGLADDQNAAPEDHVMLNELRVRCTMAMLLCLDRNYRVAYVLGDVLELDQSEAAEILDISAANFRQRLSRARKLVVDFTSRTCGLANHAAPCACVKRLPTAMAQGRVGDAPSVMMQGAPPFDEVRNRAAQLAQDLRVAKLQRATGPLALQSDFALAVLRLVDVSNA